MNERQSFDNALARLLANPLLHKFSPEIEAVRTQLLQSEDPLQEIEMIGGRAAALVRLQLAGYFDLQAQDITAQNVDENPIATDLGDNPPSREAQIKLSNLDPESILCFLTDLPSEPFEQVANTTRETTFIFLADPQPNRADGRNDDNPVVKTLSSLNTALNQLDTINWPENLKLSCGGQKINPNGGIFFGGDLCQCGGDYNGLEQAVSTPPYYNGGWELEIMRRLFQKNYVPSDLTFHSSAVQTKYNTYFGLGNHDIQSSYTPPVGWYRGLSGGWSSPEDYWRWQMWNFICQMHTGVSTSIFGGKTSPIFPITMIDADGQGSNDWTKRSFNYFVNLGPVDVYQLHVYGGDSDYGRANGLNWLSEQLSQRGKDRPVIIVQHYPFDITSDTNPTFQPNWSTAQRDALLAVLEPYNVIALLTGHDHNRLTTVPYTVPVPNSSKKFQTFRPGTCQKSNFAVVRVTDTTFDIAEGTVNANGSVQWLDGYSKILPNSAETPLYRLWNPQVWDHFYTTSLVEEENAQQHLGYKPESIMCKVYTEADTNLVPLYRAFNPTATDHFYTTSYDEIQNAVHHLGYTSYEGIQCYVFPYVQDAQPIEGAIPLYRAFNPTMIDHFYTTSYEEIERASGFHFEKIQCYVLPYD